MLALAVVVIFEASPNIASNLALNAATQPSVPKYEWKFLSASEKAVVDAALIVIQDQRFRNVSLNLVDDMGIPYIGPIEIVQESTQFDYSVGGVPNEQFWADYAAMTPSRTYHIWASNWNIVEPTEGTFHFNEADNEYQMAVQHGMSEFHLRLHGPIMRDPSAGCCIILPNWAKTLNHTSLLKALEKYVTALVTHFKGRVQQYEIWDEANAYWANGNLPIGKIIDIIKMEALTIRHIDPNARICIDLDNATPYSVQWQNRWGRSNWTTEDFVQKLMAAEVPFDIIGLETHYGDGTAPRKGGVDALYNRLIELGKLGKPLYVWEDGMVSHIDPKYQAQMRGDFWVGPWHGTPSEEKQAEFMVAETIVYLGNPSVLGVEWLMLVDQREGVSVFWNECDGVLRENGTGKPSFYALEALWSDLKVNMTLHSDNGVALFRGLAGNYAVLVEGYEPATIQVAEGKPNAFLLTLKKTPEHRHAEEILALVKSRLNDAGNSSFWSLVARSQLITARTEYEIAAQALKSHDYAKVLDHSGKALALVDDAFTTELSEREIVYRRSEGQQALERKQQDQQRQQQQQQQQQLVMLGIVAIAVVVAFTGIKFFRRRRRFLAHRDTLTRLMSTGTSKSDKSRKRGRSDQGSLPRVRGQSEEGTLTPLRIRIGQGVPAPFPVTARVVRPPGLEALAANPLDS
jgi:hypothetical protein